MSRACAVGECAHCLRGLVVEAVEHFVHVQGAKSEHEPFSRDRIRKGYAFAEVGCLHIWSWEIIHSFETEACVLY